jgi:hypothetical protein
MIKQHDQEAERSIKEIVEKHGWYVALFHATNYIPSFAYTIGLWKTFKHPEIISFGFKTDTLGEILNISGAKVKSGERIKILSNYTDIFESGRAQFINVNEDYIKDYFGYGLWYNEHKPFPALQLVWTDRNDKFPWEKDFEEEFKFKQPLLDRSVDFKFREEKNLGIFTSRQYLEDKKPILYVVHDEEGDWQFLTGDLFVPADGRLVCLEEMTKRDKTLNQVFDLGYGESAERDFVGGEWRRKKTEE